MSDQINKVYIRGLRMHDLVSKGELEDYVKDEIKKEIGINIEIKDSWIARSPPGFAFIELHSREDTDYVIKYLDNKPGCSDSTLHVEQAREIERRDGGGRGRGRGRSSFRGGRDSRPRSPRRRSPPRHRSPVPRRAMSPPRREQRYDSYDRPAARVNGRDYRDAPRDSRGYRDDPPPVRGYDDRDVYRGRDPVPMYRDEYDRRGAPPPRERYDPLPPPRDAYVGRDAGFRDDHGGRYRPRSPVGGAPRRRSFSPVKQRRDDGPMRREMSPGRRGPPRGPPLRERSPPRRNIANGPPARGSFRSRSPPPRRGEGAGRGGRGGRGGRRF